MVKLILKKSNSHWIKIDDTIEFLIDYPTRKQEQTLQELLYKGTELQWVNMITYKQHCIKFSVKDWKGIEYPCKLVDNELEDDLWWALVKDIKQMVVVFEKINEEIEFLEVDKKN